MSKKVLITGGAGFIGSHLADELLGAGYEVQHYTSINALGTAVLLESLLDRPIEPIINGRYRIGDVRHCFADISKAQALLGYEPQTHLEEGLTL